MARWLLGLVLALAVLVGGSTPAPAAVGHGKAKTALVGKGKKKHKKHHKKHKKGKKGAHKKGKKGLS